ncbi:hypothetical protein NJ7G_2184 [Natrinema sp. J7-2]|nr:hypothetical protein NJ7G_2184 [Natrinema sp. J7-2]
MRKLRPAAPPSEGGDKRIATRPCRAAHVETDHMTVSRR